MSNQSGISANEELLNLLHSAPGEAGDSFVAIVANISPDSTVVEFTEKCSSLEALIGCLADAPAYAFVHNGSKNPNSFDFFSYVPDLAPVRSKMLYASTKNTLLRQVGSNSVTEQPMVSEASEIADYVNGVYGKVSEASLLTESEKIGREINEEQRSMRVTQSHKLVSQSNGTPSALSFSVNSGSSDSLKSLLASNNLVTFVINMQTEQVEIADQKNIGGASDITLLAEHPTYTVFRNGELYYFIYSCPSGSKVKERMLYASNKQGFVNYFGEKEGITFTRIIEIGDAEELEVSLISSSNETEHQQHEESSRQTDGARKFNRPKGPARRRKA